MYTINFETLNTLKDLSYEHKEEQCCFMVLDSSTGQLTLDASSCSKGRRVSYESKDNFGNIITKERASCAFEIKSDLQSFQPFIFHSHPIDSKPYPSYEDITKVIKRFYIDASIIGTRDGLYIISSKDPKVIQHISKNYYKNNRLKHDEFNREYYPILEHYLGQIYKLLTTNGRNNPIPTTPLLKIIERINNKLRINIQYYPWEQIVSEQFKFVFDL
jgi:hypothetical protein